jgi:iron complex transport system substrate-binding protein
MFRKSLFALLIVIFLAACGPAATAVPTQTAAPIALPSLTPTTPAIHLTDGLNRPVSLPEPAQRIVSLAPSNTEVLFAVGAGAQVVGRDSFSDFPAGAKSVQDIGGSMGKYDTEAIVALHPDLVLAGEINTPELVSSLEQLGLTVYYLKNPVTLEEMYTNLETVGTLTGHADKAANTVDSLKGRVAAVDARIAPLNSRPTVYYELDASDPAKPYTAGAGTFVDQLIQRAGGVNVFSQLQSPYAPISLEQLVVADPQIIILGDAAYGESAEKLAARPGLASLQAVKSKQIYAFDDNLVSRPGPRLVDGLEALAKLLHPDAFK